MLSARQYFLLSEESTSMSTTSAAPAASQLDPSQRRLAAGLLVSLSLHGLLLALQFGIPGLRPASGAPLTVSLAPAPAAVVAPQPVPAAPVPPLPVPASPAPTPPVPPVQPVPLRWWTCWSILQIKGNIAWLIA
jgi:hypothetical protein